MLTMSTTIHGTILHAAVASGVAGVFRVVLSIVKNTLRPEQVRCNTCLNATAHCFRTAWTAVEEPTQRISLRRTVRVWRLGRRLASQLSTAGEAPLFRPAGSCCGGCSVPVCGLHLIGYSRSRGLATYTERSCSVSSMNMEPYFFFPKSGTGEGLLSILCRRAGFVPCSRRDSYFRLEQ